jgi:hypothetical protein
MTDICLYGKLSGKNNFVKVKALSKDKVDELFPEISLDDALEFDPMTLAEEDQYRFIQLTDEDFILEPFITMLNSTASYNNIQKTQLAKLDGIFIAEDVSSEEDEEKIYDIKFQRLWARYHFTKPSFQWINNDECKFNDKQDIVMLRSAVDAFYQGSTKRLYFNKFEYIKKIFTGIDRYYRVACKEDYDALKQIDFVDMKVCTSRIGIQSSRKIASMMDNKIFEQKNFSILKSYAEKYKQILPIENNKIVLNENKDIDLLYSIANELFYTSELSNELRKTNSVIKLETTINEDDNNEQ